jgi:hypothetical protein
MVHSLSRKTFTTSRVAEFCTQSELVRLTGHAVEYWPRYILKELVDNALDAAEEAGTAPVIKINASNGIITVDDNGPGIPAETVTSILDYGTRTSSRAAYVAPTRGAQGNALQTILAMPYVLAGGEDKTLTIIESRGVKHTISFSQDPVLQDPCIEHTQEPSTVTTGASISVAVPQALLGNAEDALTILACNYNWVNPHLDISIATSEDVHTWTAEDTTWRKWGSGDPTCPLWYDLPRFKNLIAANVALAGQCGEPCRTVADFISEFRGLSSTAKRRDICANAGVSRMSLADLLGGGQGHVTALLRAMKWAATRPVKPRDLGLLGEDFLRNTLECYAIESETFRYKKAEVEVDGVPYLAECAFAYRPGHVRVALTGLNWSVTIVGGGPFHDLGDDENMGSLLEGQWAGPHEPVMFLLHLASPRLDFLDKGKSSVVLPDEVCQAITGIIMDVTKPWAKQRRAEDRSVSAESRRMDRLAAGDKPMTIKDAAYNVMTEAYMTVSDNDTLPANARQIMYAARPKILRLAKIDTLNDTYFTQTLLVDYINENPHECKDWNVVWSDRGHFAEPHTGKIVGLGTLAVRDYLDKYATPEFAEAGFAGATITTHGPDGRYGAMLYIEKEGFDPLLEQALISERHDLAIMSCKGMSVTAARELVDRTCAKYGITLLIMHDFDVSGFSIAKTLPSSNRRYKLETEGELKVIDIGLRLADVEELGLAPEPVNLGKNKGNRRQNLIDNGATEAEIAFLLDTDNPDGDRTGKRVELNAMTSRQFIDLIERKLAEHGIGKVIPDEDRIAEAYRLFVRNGRIKQAVEAAIEAMEDAAVVDVPAGLDAKVREYLEDHLEASWDAAVRFLVDDGDL